METRKDRLSHPYEPKLHDYVKWYSGNGQTHEGWVYYKGDEHISIELGVKDKPHCELTNHKHCKTHILLVCPSWEWGNLEYIKSRRDFHDDRPHRDRTEDNI